MGAEEPLDNELEQELDSLYRKVAGLDQPGDQHNWTVSKTDGKRPAAVNIQKPITTRSSQKKRRRFRTSILGWGLISGLVFLGAIGFFGREWLRLPVDPGIIVLPAEKTKDQGVASLPAEEKGTVLTEPPVADPPPGSRQVRYAIQIRAYPEDQKQNAITFLEELRKRSPDASMETVALAERGIWHRILLGNFSTVDEASDYRKSNSMAREHPYSFIQRKLADGP
ncbi:MAG: SPOR domain-containing protein [Proteobacteria bacterium]|nr:SPOR domain-containing protein [Pseudomonadota bacterium]MCG2739301.1 SPOR domain-containing protein [Syntrophaceae bacterium]MBU1744854.1 SPOR domain-containing protein [Pseudomonadota bacterium]MBU1965699.1 SPOR domain-containing protein [Pseudomonadota bacterium]MBU4372051.1 SPOR domain-containing protein [Pseudomonadota bacterium]